MTKYMLIARHAAVALASGAVWVETSALLTPDEVHVAAQMSVDYRPLGA